DPLDEIVAGLDASGPINQVTDHLGFRRLAVARPASELGGAFLVEFDSDRGHGNTDILPWSLRDGRYPLGSTRSGRLPSRSSGSLAAARSSTMTSMAFRLSSFSMS